MCCLILQAWGSAKGFYQLGNISHKAASFLAQIAAAERASSVSVGLFIDIVRLLNFVHNLHKTYSPCRAVSVFRRKRKRFAVSKEQNMAVYGMYDPL